MRISAFAATVVIAAAAVLGIAGPASAHDQLLSTTPADGSTLTSAPAEVTLTFSDIVPAASGDANQVQVTDAACHDISDGAVQIQDNVVTQKLKTAADGPVHVLWRVVSRDGHPVSGAFSFTVGDAAAASDAPTCATAGPTAAPIASSPTAAASVWVIAGIAVGVLVVAGIIVLLVVRSRRTDHQ